jgi:hypothetical protein
MQYEPTAQELLDAIAELLRDEVQPLITDEVVHFRLRVALNALGIVSRELDEAERMLTRERQRLESLLGLLDSAREDADDTLLADDLLDLNRQLVERIRAGAAPTGTFDHLVQAELAQVAVANPKFLQRVLPDVRAAGLEWPL